MQRKILFLYMQIIGILLIIILFSYITPHDPNVSDITASLQPPSFQYWFGTDIYGRDIFSRTLTAGRVSILATLLIVVISGAFGTLIGMLAGYLGGIADYILMGICDIFLAFPQMILAIGITGVLGGGLRNAILALAFSNWMSYARLARSATLKEKNELYVKSARFAGLSGMQILTRHIFINIKEIILVTMALNFASTLMSLAGLSFIGIGVQPPNSEWGSMINEGRLYLAKAPWISMFPAFAVVSVVLLFHHFGEKLRKHTIRRRT